MVTGAVAGVLLTVEAPHDGLLVCPLLYNKLYVRVCAGDLGKVIAEEGPCVGGRGPLVAELEDELAYLGNEGNMAVCWSRGELRTEERSGREQLGGHGGQV